MKQTNFYCDRCKRELLNLRIEIFSKQYRDDNLHFCDRKCLLDYFEENPGEYSNRKIE